MKLTNETVEVLKNFSTINSNILIRPGTEIKTANTSKTVFAIATVPDDFPTEIGIYDLGEFLSIVNLLGGAENTDFEFDEKSMTLTSESNRSRVKYWYASENVLDYPQKKINMPSPQVTFEMNGSVLSQIKRAASTFGHSTLSMYNDGGNTILGKVYDPQYSTHNTFEMDICEFENNPGVDFDFIFNIQNLKYLSFGVDDFFDVNLAAKGKGRIAEFSAKNISYYVAVDASSYMNNVSDSGES